jgi:hypothetical protein
MLVPESIKLFIEEQAFSRSFDLPPPPTQSPSLPATHRKTEKENLLTEAGEGGGRGVKSIKQGPL